MAVGYTYVHYESPSGLIVLEEGATVTVLAIIVGELHCVYLFF